MAEMTFKPQVKPKGKVVEKEEFVNQEVILNQKFLYSLDSAGLLALRKWAHTQEEMFVSNSEKNKKMDALVKWVDSRLYKSIFGGNDV